MVLNDTYLIRSLSLWVGGRVLRYPRKTFWVMFTFVLRTPVDEVCSAVYILVHRAACGIHVVAAGTPICCVNDLFGFWSSCLPWFGDPLCSWCVLPTAWHPTFRRCHALSVEPNKAYGLRNLPAMCVIWNPSQDVSRLHWWSIDWLKMYWLIEDWLLDWRLIDWLKMYWLIEDWLKIDSLTALVFDWSIKDWLLD